MSPRATRPAGDGAASPSTRRRPALPGRSRKGAGTTAEATRPAAPLGEALPPTAMPHDSTSPAVTTTWADLVREPVNAAPHMAMPRLMGQPAYARPPRPLAVETPRPLDPDDLPLEAFRSEEDQAIAQLLTRTGQDRAASQATGLRPSSVGGLRGIAGRLFGSRS